MSASATGARDPAWTDDVDPKSGFRPPLPRPVSRRDYRGPAEHFTRALAQPGHVPPMGRHAVASLLPNPG